HVSGKLFTLDDLTCRAKQFFQKVVLDRRQLHHVAIAPHHARAHVNLNISDRESFTRRALSSLFGSGAAQYCAYARSQFARGERFWKVIVRAYLKTYYAVNVVAARCEHQNGNA